jgi:hypothetical protein
MGAGSSGSRCVQTDRDSVAWMLRRVHAGMIAFEWSVGGARAFEFIRSFPRFWQAVRLVRIRWIAAALGRLIVNCRCYPVALPAPAHCTAVDFSNVVVWLGSDEDLTSWSCHNMRIAHDMEIQRTL